MRSAQPRGADASSLGSLFGRDEEVLRSRRALDVVATGRAHTLLVEGEAGIGKSRLVEELAAQGRARGYRVLIGRADELERRRSVGPILDALGRARRRADSDEALIDEATDRIEAAAVEGPLVLIVEDVHWADEATIAVMRSVARRLAYLPILLATTYRPHPQTRALDRFIDAATREGATSLRLAPLGDAETSEMARALLGVNIGPELRRMLGTAAGNPLYISELINSLMQEDVLEGGDITARAREAMPATLRVTILRRLSFLPQQTLDALRHAAVLGSSFTVEDLAAATGRPARALLDALDPAIRSMVLGAREHGLRFRHDLIREAIYEDLAEPVRATMHLETAKALRNLSVPLERLAEHLLRAPTGAAPEFGELLDETARGLEAQAPNLAIALWERALEVVGDDAQLDAIRMRMLWSLAAVGRGEEAVTLAERMLAASRDPEVEADIRLARARALQRGGRGAQALPELLEIVEDTRYPQSKLLLARAALCASSIAAGRLVEAGELAERVIEEARLAGERDVMAGALYWGGMSFVMQGYSPRGIRHLKEAKELDADRRLMLTSGYLGYAIALLQADRLDEAATTIEEGRKREQEVGGANMLAAFAHIAGAIRLFKGDLDDGVAEAKAGVHLVEEQGGTPIGLFASTAVLSWVALNRGARAEAEEWTRYAYRALEQRGPGPALEGIFWMDALARSLAGDHAGAFELLRNSWAMTEPVRYGMSWTVIAPDLIHLALRVNETAYARSVVEDAAEGARRAGGVPSADAAVLRCRGLVEDDPDALRAAADLLRPGPRRLELALATEEAATTLARRGDAVAARPLFEEALAFYEGNGAAHAVARVTAVMRAAGIRRASRAKRRRPALGWEALTDSERAVARMAAEGMTNPQIAEQLVVSKYTVMTHLQHVFAKLQIASRVELAAQVARAGAGPSDGSSDAG